MRKLASIQKIWNVEPIEGADKIELAHVLGWQCVVNKGQFHRYDIAVYFEIDSFLPVREEFEFLRSSSYRKTDIMGEGFRLRTLKFKGQISQGLLLPVEIFPELEHRVWTVGDNVTDLLGVRKWEIEERASTGGTIIGNLPYDVPHTDETRIQSAPELLEQFAGKRYYITTKMDGSSHSVSIDENGFHVCGHNFEYKDDGSSSFYEYVKATGLRRKMEQYMKDTARSVLTIQGEFCAPGIQSNRLRLKKPEWYVFTIRADRRRVGLYEWLAACENMNLEPVPLEESGDDLLSKYPTVDALLARAEGTYPNGGQKEGIVVRTSEPVWANTESGFLSVKAINNKYLLKNE